MPLDGASALAAATRGATEESAELSEGLRGGPLKLISDLRYLFFHFAGAPLASASIVVDGTSDRFPYSLSQARILILPFVRT